jgi:two-component system chemotaxis sensor kinase CheA
MGEIGNPAAVSGGIDLSQFYGVFFEEAGENLASMEGLLLALDVEEPVEDDLHAIFRAAHSIKGGAATFGFADVAELTHDLETLLDKLRRHELKPSAAMVDALLEAGDLLKAQLAKHRGDEGAESPDTTEIRARIRTFASGEAPEAAAPKGRLVDIRVGPLPDPAFADNLFELFRDVPDMGTIEKTDEGQADAEGCRHFRVRTPCGDEELRDLFSFHVDREHVHIRPVEAAAPAASAPAAPAKSAVQEDDGFGFFMDPHEAREAAAQAATTPVPPPVAAPKPVAKAEKAADKPKAGGAVDSATLRVAVEKVDQLINLVGELVITQAVLAQSGKGLDPVRDQSLLAGMAELERNTRALQESVMSIRMIPMAVVFNRFPRMIRDLAAKLGKQVELRTEGEATEMDKGLIEKITDPLTHLLRNAVDHGIETVEKRRAAGKPDQGIVYLSAAHKGGSIVIEVRDDGGGLPRDKILAKAKAQGFPVTDDTPDAELWPLIFAPGFSTAEVVTDVSGRGVGMDVVKKNITALGGTVEIRSVAGKGTTMSVRLPLTLAIMDGMSVGVAGETYILPLGSVVESFQVGPDAVKSIARQGNVIKVREEYLPEVAMREVFDVPADAPPAVEEVVMVIEADGARVALRVDELLGQHQVVVKNLEANYKRVPNVAGATILGDGRVALIVDCAALVKRSRH